MLVPSPHPRWEGYEVIGLNKHCFKAVYIDLDQDDLLYSEHLFRRHVRHVANELYSNTHINTIGLRLVHEGGNLDAIRTCLSTRENLREVFLGNGGYCGYLPRSFTSLFLVALQLNANITAVTLFGFELDGDTVKDLLVVPRIRKLVLNKCVLATGVLELAQQIEDCDSLVELGLVHMHPSFAKPVLTGRKMRSLRSFAFGPTEVERESPDYLVALLSALRASDSLRNVCLTGVNFEGPEATELLHYMRDAPHITGVSLHRGRVCDQSFDVVGEIARKPNLKSFELEWVQGLHMGSSKRSLKSNLFTALSNAGLREFRLNDWHMVNQGSLGRFLDLVSKSSIERFTVGPIRRWEDGCVIVDKLPHLKLKELEVTTWELPKGMLDDQRVQLWKALLSALRRNHVIESLRLIQNYSGWEGYYHNSWFGDPSHSEEERLELIGTELDQNLAWKEWCETPSKMMETKLSEERLSYALRKACNTSPSACYSVFRTLGVKMIADRGQRKRKHNDQPRSANAESQA